LAHFIEGHHFLDISSIQAAPKCSSGRKVSLGLQRARKKSNKSQTLPKVTYCQRAFWEPGCSVLATLTSSRIEEKKFTVYNKICSGSGYSNNRRGGD